MKKIIHTSEAPAAIGPYSQATLVNGTLYISGQIPVDPESGKLVEGIQKETHQVMKNLKAILTAAGVGLGILLTRPTWVVGAITAGLSAYKLAQKVLPVLGWRKFEVH